MEVIRLGNGLSIRYKGQEVLFITEEDVIDRLEETVRSIVSHTSFAKGYEMGRATVEKPVGLGYR